ncbi:MAG: PD40 domain-containing protein [Bacteroidales bacterium]|nr:PD40 domain-containing protein [Candidatus Cacconaster scatequi]
MKNLHRILAAVVILASCSVRESDDFPRIYPDYVGVTVPEGLAPLRFSMTDGSRCSVKSRREGDTLWYSVTSSGVRYKEFPVYVCHDEIDTYVVYRLIEPGYESWRDISICQRELATWKESPVVTNRVNDMGCLNCHSFQDGNPDRMFFHARGKGGGTVFVDKCGVRKVNLAASGPRKQGTYPAWHPSGRYVVFSSNDTRQCFPIGSTQPVEVYDTESDILLYDVAKDSVSLPRQLSGAEVMETFPTWNNAGDRLYYCAADSISDVSINRGKVHYRLMSIGFDGCSFVGEPRTEWEDGDASASFPRINGKWLMFTRSDYGTFPIWHKEADLWLLNLETGKSFPAKEINSEDAESYHSWSSNGKWLVFSSRREDSRYTRLYFSHFDEEGRFSKPFLLPQKKAELNHLRLKSYNIPEFVRGEVPDRQKEIKKLFD